MENQSYPFSLEILKKYAEAWAERFPVIEQVTLCRCKGSGATYALVFGVDEALYHAYAEWWKAKSDSDFPDKLLPMKDFLDWQADGGFCSHIKEELASAYFIPPEPLELLESWIWFFQPSGTDLPSDLLAPGGEALYARYPEVLPNEVEVTEVHAKEKVDQNIFIKKGSGWIAKYEGEETIVSGFEGYEVIRLLLKEPSIPGDNTKIWKEMGKTGIRERSLHHADPETLRKINDDIRKTKDKLVIAEDTDNKSAAGTLKEELEGLERQRSRERQYRGSSNSKINRNIKGLYDRALEDLEEKHPALWQYLTIHIRLTAQGYIYYGEHSWITE